MEINQVKRAERYIEALRRSGEEDDFFQQIADTITIMVAEEGKTLEAAIDLVRTGVRR